MIYARSLYKSDRAGISVGANLNITNHDMKSPSLNMHFSYDVNFYSLSGGLGLHGYQTVNLTERQSLRFQLGTSINNLGRDLEKDNYRSILINQFRAGALIGWNYKTLTCNNITINVAYQLERTLESDLFIISDTRKVGLETGYSIKKWNTYLALRGGLRWLIYHDKMNYQYTTFGGTINIHGFYLDFATLPERMYGSSDIQLAIGYQKALN
mgnify:CR=1 FL=1